jgi:hypothetical protein
VADSSPSPYWGTYRSLIHKVFVFQHDLEHRTSSSLNSRAFFRLHDSRYGFLR